MPSETYDQMLRYRLAVVTSDKRLQREIKRVTAATNARASFASSADVLDPSEETNLVVFDARDEAPAANHLAGLPRDLALAYIVDGDSLFERVSLLGDRRVESILAREERLDDSEFIVSATKSLGHDLFGLHKYFPWGVTVFSMTVKSYAEKSDGLDVIMAYAEASGMRGPVRDRIQLVSDELMMNALYHAPTDEQGKERYRDKTRKELAQLSEVSAVQVQYGCSGRYFGISVRDNFGSLTREKIVDYLTRIRQGVGAQIESKTTGAGLGIVSVAQSVSKLVFNIVPGVSCEVIALFEVDLISRGKVGARSVHVFVDPAGDLVSRSGIRPPAPAGDDDATEHAFATEPAAPSGLPLPWLVVGLLASVLSALAIAYLFTRDAAPAERPHISVIAQPADATIEINGSPIDGSGAFDLPEADSYVITVEKDGFAPWNQTFSADELRGELRMFVTLPPNE
ncbi:PEGA domain-containing protein [Haliangium ochraceum]|uniref:PEGA domain protein n=1 Tax=Haliangium ochraceum (strain DSM 14365 / JCM 11303 / SMP-2) TaxID=502025 RepID=D0LGK0_HALO1|nr:PEGA domain-containing protein [Haliangium ochraceum]ACY12746.1 PEGA domain protein [Haliangium ochraceum DSM 14365]